jgi:hypothetical protein
VVVREAVGRGDPIKSLPAVTWDCSCLSLASPLPMGLSETTDASAGGFVNGQEFTRAESTISCRKLCRLQPAPNSSTRTLVDKTQPLTREPRASSRSIYLGIKMKGREHTLLFGIPLHAGRRRPEKDGSCALLELVNDVQNVVADQEQCGHSGHDQGEPQHGLNLVDLG